MRSNCEQFVPNQISNLCLKLYKYLMFESSEFLASYLPEYFLNVFMKMSAGNLAQKTQKSALEVISQFLKFSRELYSGIDQQSKFIEFLNYEFQVEGSASQKKLMTNRTRGGKAKILEFIEQNVDKVSLLFIQLYIKIYGIQQKINTFQLSSQQITSYSQNIIKNMSHARLQYQFLKLQFNNLKDYDNYIFEVFSCLLSENLSNNFQKIMEEIISCQYNNISESVLKQIQYMLNKDSPQLNSYESNLSVQQKQSLQFIRKVLGKKHKKIEKIKSSPAKKKISSSEKCLKPDMLSISPIKNSNTKNKQFSWSPLKKYQSFARLKKQKAMNKKRTIFHQRRTVHIPKSKQYLQNIPYFSSQSTLGSIQREKRFQKKAFKFENSQSTYQDYDNEAILVRSTPKPNKKAIFMKAISQKLDF